MDRPVTQKLRVPESRDHAKDTLLFGYAQSRLKSNQVPQASGAILTSQLNDRMRSPSRSRVRKSDRLERTEAQRLTPARVHLFHRHATGEVRNLVELVTVKLIGRGQCVGERVVLVLRHRAVEIGALVV